MMVANDGFVSDSIDTNNTAGGSQKSSLKSYRALTWLIVYVFRAAR